MNCSICGEHLEYDENANANDHPENAMCYECFVEEQVKEGIKIGGSI